MDFIRKRVDEIHDEIQKLRNELTEIQNICPHADVKKYNKADTGNYCIYDDRYWKECICNTCGKQWVEDQ